MDLAKAFDTVCHKNLLIKLQKVGIRASLLEWFASYLKGRKHKVRIGNTCSSELVAGHGVPQGSVLGPILFNFYINDLYLLPLRAKVTGYADDTSLLYSAETKEEVERDFKHDLDILQIWFLKKNYT